MYHVAAATFIKHACGMPTVMATGSGSYRGAALPLVIDSYNEAIPHLWPKTHARLSGAVRTRGGSFRSRHPVHPD